MKRRKRQTFFAATVLFGITAPLANAQEADKKPLTPTSEVENSPKTSIKADDPSLKGYTIGEQDVLEVVVWREKEFSGPVIVRPDGKITIPLVGETYVLGMTPLQVQDVLTEKLKPFVNNPEVTVAVKEVN